MIPIIAVPPAPTFIATPLALYVHWPWCVRKCPYCDFNSHEIAPPRKLRFAALSPQGAKKHLGRPGVFLPSQDEAAYLAALIADLEAALPAIWGRSVISIFIGGGTPSLMSGKTADALLAALRMRIPLLPEAEITLEANPGTLEAGKFAAFRDAGINRLSLGIQSFDDRKLAALGRIHSGDEARHAIDQAQTHFERVNLDLMYALPSQTLREAQQDMAAAIATSVSHLSAYHLTLEPNTPFHHAPPPVPDDDLAADMQEMVEAELAAAGFLHYETSAFAKPAQQCRHNLNYWQFGDYLGIGAGAHSKLSDHTGIRREARPRHPRDYLADPATRNWQPVAREDLPGEFMMNALRLTAGVPQALFIERTGLPLAAIEKSALASVSNARRAGLLDTADGYLRPTAQGRRFLNRLLAEFMS
ncbi:MAG: radical SAM family heme chaperone HemW [Rhodocyclaceae bacterium]|nr:radical SAM family heme chaperone HemW [Rhodocyclaceae bacterium]